jgi:hypothetical protein
MRLRLRPAAALAPLLVVALIGAGCGNSKDDSSKDSGSTDATALLQKAFAQPVKSADLNIDAKVDLDGVKGINGPLEFKVAGPFKSNGTKALPVADFKMTTAGAGQNINAGFILTNDNAYVTIQGQSYEVGTKLFNTFKSGVASAPAQANPSTTLKKFGVDPAKWLTDAKVEDGPDVGGDSTRKITGTVDVGALVKDVFAAARSPKLRKQLEATGQPVPSIPNVSDKELKQVEDAIKKATVEVDVDGNDVARRVAAAIDFTIPAGVNAGSLKGGSATFEYSLPKIGVEPVIKAPANPQPLSGLLGSLGLGGSLKLPSQ